MGIFLKTLQRHGASRRVPNQAFQLVPSMRWHLGVGVQRKTIGTGTAGACECGEFPFMTKARSNTTNCLSGPLAKGDAPFDGGSHGTGELGLVAEEGVIACGHDVVDARLQVSQLAQRANDPPTDLLEHCRNVSIAGRLALDEARLEALVSTIKTDSLKEDKMKHLNR